MNCKSQKTLAREYGLLVMYPQDTMDLIPWSTHQISSTPSYSAIPLQPSPISFSVTTTGTSKVTLLTARRDEFSLYYSYPPAKNSSLFVPGSWNTSTPIAVAWIGQSLTPLRGVNGGWRYYDVDAVTFTIYESYNFYADISLAKDDTPVPWQFLYSARETYDPHGTWPSNAPLNATFWDFVTKQMSNNETMVNLYNLYETRASPLTPNCTSSACQAQKICFMRSGNALQGLACGKRPGAN